MIDSHYIIYQYIDRHPVIFILMLTVIFAWTYDLSRKYMAKAIKGDKSASFKSSFYSLLSTWMMVGIFQVSMEHWPTITRQEDPIAFIHEHRYDILNEDSILHSPFCGCKQKNTYHSHEVNDSSANKLKDLIIKSAP